MLRWLPQLDYILPFVLVLCLVASGCGKKEATPKEIIATFASEREDEARQLSKKESERWPPEARDFFKAAKSGRWDRATNIYAAVQKKYILAAGPPTNGWGEFMMKSYAWLGSCGLTPTNYWPNPWGPQWRPVDDIYFAIQQSKSWDPDLLRYYATNIAGSLPANSVFVTGSEPGFFLVPAFGMSQKKGLAFVTLTPNKLLDDGYLKYADEMYGKMLHIPTQAVISTAFSDYEADAARRAKLGLLKPGEMFTNGAAGPTFSGDIAMMQINALLFWDLFQENPGRDFYYEERWPLDWTTPYLIPHGLIFKMNPVPMPALFPAIVDSDRAYWHEIVQQLTGLSQDRDLAFPRLSDFVEQVYLRKDFKDFRGDLRFATNNAAQITFAKARVSIARVYAWRVDNSSGATEKKLMAREADLAFRQAFALDPRLPELYQYGAFLFSLNRTNDLRFLAEGVQKVASGSTTATYLSALLKHRP